MTKEINNFQWRVRKLANAAMAAAENWERDMAHFGLVVADPELSEEDRNAAVDRVFAFISALSPRVIMELLELGPELSEEVELIICVHCGGHFSRNSIKAHVLECPDNPVVRENLRLKEELAAADYLDAESTYGVQELIAENKRLMAELAKLFGAEEE